MIRDLGEAMKPILKFCQGILLAKGRCAYQADEFSLVYETSEPPDDNSNPRILADVLNKQFGMVKPTVLLLIADTLTLTFSGNDRHLSSLDAYTNSRLWTVSSLAQIPKISGQGRLLAEIDSVESDCYSLGLIPKYEVASNKEWVRVLLSDEIPDAHYEVASDLVIGLKNGMITEFFLLQVALV